MLTHEKIRTAVIRTASSFPIIRASYFGSYAEGRQEESSDLDLLLEFRDPAVSLIMLSAIKNGLGDQLKATVDIVHAPLTKNSFIRNWKRGAYLWANVMRQLTASKLCTS